MFWCALRFLQFDKMKHDSTPVMTYNQSSMCIFNAIKKQSDIGFIVDALLGYFAYLHSLCTVVELHTNFVLIQFGM